MAYLVATVAPEGKAIALTGYMLSSDLSEWSKTLRRIEWDDVVHSWRREPTAEEIRKAKLKLKPHVQAEKEKP